MRQKTNPIRSILRCVNLCGIKSNHHCGESSAHCLFRAVPLGASAQAQFPLYVDIFFPSDHPLFCNPTFLTNPQYLHLAYFLTQMTLLPKQDFDATPVSDVLLLTTAEDGKAIQIHVHSKILSE